MSSPGRPKSEYRSAQHEGAPVIRGAPGRDNRAMSLPSPHTDPRGFLLALFNAAVSQAVPGAALARFLPPPPKGRTLVLGAGKAGGSMAAAVDALWPANAPMSGLVVTRYDYVPPAYKRQPGRIEVIEAAHPVPDEAGRRAAKRIAELTKRNAQLEKKLHVAHVLIGLQKKAHELLGIALPESDEET